MKIVAAGRARSRDRRAAQRLGVAVPASGVPSARAVPSGTVALLAAAALLAACGQKGALYLPDRGTPVVSAPPAPPASTPAQGVPLAPQASPAPAPQATPAPAPQATPPPLKKSDRDGSPPPQ